MLRFHPAGHRAGALLALSLLGACRGEPIAWGVAEYISGDAFRRPAISDQRMCRAVEVQSGRGLYRAGWDAATGALTIARSADAGATWDPAVAVDRREAADPPCERPEPAVFVDSSYGILHVVYFLEAPGASGVYYAHSMNVERLSQMSEGMFERPIALTYGHRPARTSVASRGDTVVVAYEDPNSLRGRIQLAVSTTAGHSFEARLAVPGGAGGSAAVVPHVQLGGGGVSVTWREATDSVRFIRRRGTFR